MMHRRDISVDEECPERSPEHREAFGDARPLAEVEDARRRWAADFDRRASEARTSAGQDVTLVTRTWAHPGGWDGPCWPAELVAQFSALMREMSRQFRGRPPIVVAWHDGRGVVCWYQAHAGPDERALRDRCRALFGAREQAEDERKDMGNG
ncbi:MAG TPA: hypothetical protein VIK91_27575 [Nannocystis sp.]